MASKRAIIFIDGNNLYHCMKAMGINPGSIDYLKLSEMICSKFNVVREKTIYYNSVPSIASGEEKYYKHMRFLTALENLPKFGVQRRKLQRRSNKEILEEKMALLRQLKVCQKCRPVVEKNCLDCIGDISEKEKGIDVMLAVEAIEKAMKNEYDYCILVSGDADFIPVLNLIRANGKQIKSVSVPAGYSSDIRNTFPSDFMVLKKDELLEKCQKK